MANYEKGIEEKILKKEDIEGKLDIPTLKYFWQASPLSRNNKNSIPKFLRDIRVFREFSDNDLRILSRFLHLRSFESKEVIFEQGDVGYGFYLIFSGHVEIIAKDFLADMSLTGLSEAEINQGYVERRVALLERKDYFGEIALIQESSLRTASAVSKDYCTLLGIFKSDIEELIVSHPVVAAKLIQAMSSIVANRFTSVTQEVKLLKYKIRQYEEKERSDAPT